MFTACCLTLAVTVCHVSQPTVRAYRSGMSHMRNAGHCDGLEATTRDFLGFMPASVRRPRHSNVPGQSWKRQILTGRVTEGAHAKGQRATARG